MVRVGQNRMYTPFMTVYLVISLPKIPYIHRIYIWFWPTLLMVKRSTKIDRHNLKILKKLDNRGCRTLQEPTNMPFGCTH